MKNENLSLLKGKKKVINKGDAEFISASSTQVVSQVQQLQSSKILNQVQNDFINKKAFTLIELLVVVLIIGILAAVAVPQYNKAVEKARAAEALANLKSLVQAEEIYKMENGQTTTNLSDLAWTVSNSFYTYRISNIPSSGMGFEAVANRKHEEKKQLKYFIYYAYNGILYCVSEETEADSICRYLCKSKPLHTRPDGNNACVISGFNV